MRKKRALITTIGLVVILTSLVCLWDIGVLLSPQMVRAETETNTDTMGISVEYHSEDEVRDYLMNHGAKIYDPVTYEITPTTTSPYDPGSLTKETLNSAINMLNQVRYIAGIDSNVTLNEDAIIKTQAASFLNFVNDILTHYPTQPLDMDSTLYQLGATGARSSNLGSGYSTINQSIIRGYMNDGSSKNIDRVGHRRWILNPAMSTTGFGYCNGYTALYAFDMNNTSASEYGVSWPAQTMPTEYFKADYPWSISMGYDVDIDQVQVTLVRLSDQKTWNFNSTSSDGYFNVNNDNYGQTGCIIFRPQDIDSYINGDKFQVTITGLETMVSYQVSFFDLVPVTSMSIQNMNTSANIIKGEFIDLYTVTTPSDATNQNVTWSSSNPSIAEADEYGSITGKNYGTATITATSVGNNITATYKVTVIPNNIELNKLTSTKKGQMVVTYKNNKQISGYEIVYATNSKFTKNKKVKIINKASTSKYSFTGLKAGQIYYVKVRAFVQVNGKKLYGNYGSSSSIRIMK